MSYHVENEPTLISHYRRCRRQLCRCCSPYRSCLLSLQYVTYLARKLRLGETWRFVWLMVGMTMQEMFCLKLICVLYPTWVVCSLVWLCCIVLLGTIKGCNNGRRLFAKKGVIEWPNRVILCSRVGRSLFREFPNQNQTCSQRNVLRIPKSMEEVSCEKNESNRET